MGALSDIVGILRKLPTREERDLALDLARTWVFHESGQNALTVEVIDPQGETLPAGNHPTARPTKPLRVEQPSNTKTTTKMPAVRVKIEPSDNKGIQVGPKAQQILNIMHSYPNIDLDNLAAKAYGKPSNQEEKEANLKRLRSMLTNLKSLGLVTNQDTNRWVVINRG
jgi:hypothetical protein